MLSAVDALTDCFGLITVLAETWGIVPTACARACNNGFFAKYTWNNTDITYQLPHDIEITNPDTIPASRLGSAIANILVPPAALLIARFAGKRYRLPDSENKKNYEQEQRRTNDYV
jgi:hypothetical protein